ncbi:MAG: tRNA (cytidine(34)-2'-O)-methyltransferase [Rhodospirillales bacterium]|nr:tRNA (cytidine(34)-2'-O)-methyltransferase [Rhodospirillales bacterium]
MRLVLFEPDIPQNTGNLLRTATCMSVPVEIIGPCGFVFSDRRFKRAGLDYLDRAAVSHHASWRAFSEARRSAPRKGRLVLLTTKGSIRHSDFRFEAGDALMVGSEERGVPDFVHAAADARIRIPIAPELRSLNVAVAGAIVIAEALRQLDAFPKEAA